jgi:DNA-binding MarR family transcriptional regulator
MEIEKLIKQTRFKDSFHKAIVNLIYTSNFFRDAHLELFKKYDIQGQHYNIMRILRGKHPQPVSPGYIKEVMIDKGRDLTRLIDKLERLQWVERSICPENKRKVNVKLTDHGLDFIDRITDELSVVDSKLRALDEKEYELLSNLLDRMRG